MQRAFRLEPKTWKLIALAALVAAAAIGFWPYLAPALRLLLGGGAIAFCWIRYASACAFASSAPLAAGVAILGVAAALIGLVLLLAPFMVRQVGALADAIPSSVGLPCARSWSRWKAFSAIKALRWVPWRQIWIGTRLLAC